MDRTVDLESCLQLVCDKGIMTIERQCDRCDDFFLCKVTGTCL